MQSLINQLIDQSALLQWFPKPLVTVGFQVFFCVLILAFVAVFAMLAGYAERRVAGRIQSRIGPNRVGPQGILQSVADGIKVFFKEDIIPALADPILFRVAPYLVFLGMFLAFAVMPFSSHWVIAELDLGVFYLLAVEALVVVGVVMSGWSSNNKWSLLGGMRSAAQIVSYEVPVSLSLLAVVLTAGTMNIQKIIAAQGAWPWHWNVMQTPFLFVAFFVFLTGVLAEGNRMPFDMPEAESELVSGYNTEYSGFRFVLFFFAEFSNLYLIGAFATILFLGGWQAGPLPEFFAGLFGGADGWFGSLVANLVEMAVFQVKTLSLVFLIMQLRWTVPRVRVDQLMTLCWKYLVPIAFVNLVATGLWLVLVPDNWTTIVSSVLVIMVVGIGMYFFYRVWWHLKFMKAKVRWNPLS